MSVDRIKGKTEACEMKILRKTEEVTKKEIIRREDARKSLNINNIKEIIQIQRLRWFGHMNRTGESRTVLATWQTDIDW